MLKSIINKFKRRKELHPTSSLNCLGGVNVISDNTVALKTSSVIYSWHRTSFYVRFNDGTFCLYTNYYKLNVLDDYSLDSSIIDFIEKDTCKFLLSNLGVPIQLITLIGAVKMSGLPSEMSSYSSSSVVNSEHKPQYLSW